LALVVGWKTFLSCVSGFFCSKKVCRAFLTWGHLNTFFLFFEKKKSFTKACLPPPKKIGGKKGLGH